MKKTFISSAVLALAFPAAAFALSMPTLAPVPASVDADTYTLKIYTKPGAKVTVIGGPADIAPKTDGQEGDVKDGIVMMEVGLSQNTDNVFSINAALDTETSEAATFTVKESAGGSAAKAGVTSEDKILSFDPLPDVVYGVTYEVTGSTSPDTYVYFTRQDTDALVAKVKSNAAGTFRVKVPLRVNETNRINASAEGAKGGTVVQLVFKVLPAMEPAESRMEVKDPEKHQPLPFKDAQTHWGESYIRTLYERGVINGKTLDRFDPDGLMTRAELTKVAMNAFGYELPTEVTEDPFIDVPKGSWFAVFVQAAKNAGVITGFEDGFHPNAYINRAAALKILLTAAGFKPSSDAAGFKDVAKNEWFAGYVAFAKKSGVVSGYKDGTFRPDGTITRAEVAKIVTVLLSLKNNQ